MSGQYTSVETCFSHLADVACRSADADGWNRTWHPMFSKWLNSSVASFF